MTLIKCGFAKNAMLVVCIIVTSQRIFNLKIFENHEHS